jgi:hypothetical protein
VLPSFRGTAVGVGVGATEVGFGGGGPPSVLKIEGAGNGVGDGAVAPTVLSLLPMSLGWGRARQADSAVPVTAVDRVAAWPTDGASRTPETANQNAARRARPRPNRGPAANVGERCGSETLTRGCVRMAPRVRGPSVRANDGFVTVACGRRGKPYDTVTECCEVRPYADGVPLAARRGRSVVVGTRAR